MTTFTDGGDFQEVPLRAVTFGMVQLFVKVPTVPGNANKSSIPEWRIVELQGDLMTNDEGMAGQYIGDLHYTKAGIPVLLVGHHILYGKEQDVEKPFLVIEKSGGKEGETRGITKEYLVRGVVTKKVIFRSRPKPIVSNVPTKV